MTTKTPLKDPAADAPRGAHWIALAICTASALLLLWPLLTGQIMFGGGRSDMFIAGYSFRLFGAESFLQNGAIPQWNPYLYGGLPYIGAMHGDIFYPSAWLRWIMPVDFAITWAMAIHFVFAGWFTYRLCRALGSSWGASIFAGVAYQLTGIVASQMSPGHDGKLFVSALAPLAMWTLLHAIRRERMWAYGAFALEVALIILGHFHMAYFLFIALGLWTLYLTLWDPERPKNIAPWKPIGFATIAILVGAGITALQVLPFLKYIPFSPRAEGGANTGWQFATSYAFPPKEIFTLLLPQFNGVLDHYWGQNGIKFHTEYIGVIPLALAALAFGDPKRKRLVGALAIGAVFFLLLSFAGHTPFYRPFYEFFPLVKKIRAMGMVFYLPALFTCVIAAVGFDRVLSREITPRRVLTVVGVIGAFAVLGVAGILQGVAQSMADANALDIVDANASALRMGSIRLLVFVILGGGALWAAAMGRITRNVAIAAIVAVTAVDLWSMDRNFYVFSPRAKELFADDPITTHLKNVPQPYRVFDEPGTYGQSLLMAYRIPVLTGYHGFSLQRYSDMLPGLQSPNLQELLSLRFLIMRDSVPLFPGYHAIMPKTRTAFGTEAFLFERDTVPAYARVLPSAAKLGVAETVPTLANPGFPVNGVALLADTSNATMPDAKPPFPPSNVKATMAEWKPGSMKISLAGADPAPSLLVVSENWYPDWHAEVDGKPGIVRRADESLIGVDLPPGAKEVTLKFDSPDYAKGKVISLIALLVAIGMTAAPALMQRRKAAV